MPNLTFEVETFISIIQKLHATRRQIWNCSYRYNQQTLSTTRREEFKQQLLISLHQDFDIMTLKFALLISMVGLVVGFCPHPRIDVCAAHPRPFATTTSLGVAVDTSDIKNGMTLELDGEPYKVLSFSIMKQARGAAKTTIKFKNLLRGNTIENTYRSGEKFETALIEKMDHQFTYEDGVSSSIVNERQICEIFVLFSLSIQHSTRSLMIHFCFHFNCRITTTS
jgi:translation elongation factor P/translation initiation factor 5A